MAASAAGTGRVGSGLHAARRTNRYLAKPHLHAPLHRELEDAGLRPVLRRVPCTRRHGSRPGPGGSYPGDGRADHGVPAVAGMACEVRSRRNRSSSSVSARGAIVVESRAGSVRSTISVLKLDSSPVGDRDP